MLSEVQKDLTLSVMVMNQPKMESKSRTLGLCRKLRQPQLSEMMMPRSKNSMGKCLPSASVDSLSMQIVPRMQKKRAKKLTIMTIPKEPS